MSSGERPMGAAKGKQPDAEALCHPPPRRGGVTVFCNPPSSPPIHRVGKPNPPLSPSGGFPPRKGHTYVHPEAPTGTPLQPW